MLNLKHLYYFYVFAQDLRTSRAAQRLGITPPALRNQLKQFEECLGGPLTLRSKGNVSITESGEMVLHYAERMFQAYEDLEKRLAASRDPRGSRFRVGAGQDLGAQFTFDLLTLVVKSNLSFSKEVRITFDSADRLLEGFKEDQFDLVVGSFLPGFDTDEGWISQKLAFPVRLFAPPSLIEGLKIEGPHAAEIKLPELIKLANSRQISLILPAKQSCLRDATDRLVLGAEVQPARTIETNSSSAIVQLIERGFGMGFVPIPCLLDFRSAASMIVLGPPGGYWSHGISLLIQKAAEGSMAKISPLADMFSP